MLSLILALKSAACVAPVPLSKTHLTSTYGERKNPFGGYSFHKGIDLQAPKGTPVYAVLSGIVDFAGIGPLGGNTVVLRGWGWGNKRRKQPLVLYGHLEEIYAVEGRQVRPGDVIGTVGETGQATGPHLHFATYVHNRDTGAKPHVNPNLLFKLCPYPQLMNPHYGVEHQPTQAKELLHGNPQEKER